MGVYEWLSQDSENHAVKKIPEGIIISAKDSSREALERFQPIALKAIEHQFEEGYEISHAHRTSRYSGNLYDELVILSK